MPQGEGTYGTTRGRPPKKNKAEKYVEKMEEKGKQVNPDKLFKKQIRQEAREKFKGGQILKKHKFKKKRKEQFKEDYETGSYQ